MRHLRRPRIAALGDWLAGLLPARGDATTQPPPDPRLERRLGTIETRLGRLEEALEGLQDALYRQSQREDEHAADMRERTKPERIARELSADARRREGCDARLAEPRGARGEARYARERYDLYRARAYGSRPTSASRLRELQRIHEGADARLRHARQRQAE